MTIVTAGPSAAAGVTGLPGKRSARCAHAASGIALLHRVAAELLPQRRQQPLGERIVVARAEAGEQRGRQRRQRHAAVDRLRAASSGLRRSPRRSPRGRRGRGSSAARAPSARAATIARRCRASRARRSPPRSSWYGARVHQLEAFGVRLHQAVLDAVVDHLHVVAGAVAADAQIAVRRRQRQEDRLEPPADFRRRRRPSGSSLRQAPDAAARAGVDVVNAVRRRAPPARRTSSWKFVLPPSMMVSPAESCCARAVTRRLGRLAGGTMTQTARGGAERCDERVERGALRAPAAAGPRCGASALRRRRRCRGRRATSRVTMLRPILPRPTKPSCIVSDRVVGRVPGRSGQQCSVATAPFRISVGSRAPADARAARGGRSRRATRNRRAPAPAPACRTKTAGPGIGRSTSRRGRDQHEDAGVRAAFVQLAGRVQIARTVAEHRRRARPVARPPCGSSCSVVGELGVGPEIGEQREVVARLKQCQERVGVAAIGIARAAVGQRRARSARSRRFDLAPATGSCRCAL